MIVCKCMVAIKESNMQLHCTQQDHGVSIDHGVVGTLLDLGTNFFEYGWEMALHSLQLLKSAPLY